MTAKARAGHPATSHHAARAHSDEVIAKTEAAILAILADFPGGLTNWQLEDEWRRRGLFDLSPQRIRSARAELSCARLVDGVGIVPPRVVKTSERRPVKNPKPGGRRVLCEVWALAEYVRILRLRPVSA